MANDERTGVATDDATPEIRAIHDAPDFETVAQAAVEAAAKIVGGRRSFLIMRDEGKVLLSAAHGMETSDLDPTGEPALFATVDKTLATARRQARYSPALLGDPPLAAVCVPLLVTPRDEADDDEHQPADGALFVDREGGQFTSDEFEAVETVGRHAVEALRNIAVDGGDEGGDDDTLREEVSIPSTLDSAESEVIAAPPATPTPAPAPAPDRDVEGQIDALCTRIVELERLRRDTDDGEIAEECDREIEELRDKVKALEGEVREGRVEEDDEPAGGRTPSAAEVTGEVDLRRRVSELETELEKAQANRSDEAEREATELRDQVKELQDRLNSETQRFQRIAAETGKKGPKKGRRKRASERTGRIDRGSLLAADIEAAELKLKVEDLEKQLAEADKRAAKFKKEASRAHAQLEEADGGASESAGEVEDLRKQISSLEALIEAAKIERSTARAVADPSASSDAEVDAFMRKIVDQCLEVSGCERGFLIHLDENGEPAFKLGRDESKEDLGADKFTFSRSVTHRAITERAPRVLINALENELEGGATRSIIALRLQTVICIPLLDREEVVGVVYLDSKRLQGEIASSDLELITGLCENAAAAIVNIRHAKKQHEGRRVESELNLAQKIQLDLLPKTFPEVEKLEVHGTMIPAKEIGGDYYDFLPHARNDAMTVCIGDVSGKGVAAGLVMMMARSSLRSIVTHAGSIDSTTSLVRSLNTVLCHDITEGGIFMSLNVLTWDAAGMKVKYTGAGHEHIIVYRAKEATVETIRAGGVAVGLSEGVNATYSEKEIELAEADQILLYTDGVTEAMNEAEEEFGLNRLAATVATYGDRTPLDLINSVIDEVKQFRGLADPTDDITLVAMRCKPRLAIATSSDELESLLDGFPE